MTCARSETVLEGVEAVYHTVSRCVRRAFLCGEDELTGKNFDHRKEWVRDRLEFLTTIFTIEVLAFALMSNHLHAMLRTLVVMLSDKEVARRWLILYPRRKSPDGLTVEPSEAEISTIVHNKKRVRTLRKRLGSVSWFMKSLNEYLARQANREDGCKGHFWEGRFKCQRLETEAAMVACSVYIDLNPIRAKIAKTPEESVFTSAWERIQSRQAKEELKERGESGRKKLSSGEAQRLKEESTLDRWLVPIESTRERRGLSSLTLDEYLSILDWTGRELRSGKRGKIPSELCPIMERLKIRAENWTKVTERYGGLFFRVVADARSMEEKASSVGRRWYKGIRAARRLFLAVSAVG